MLIAKWIPTKTLGEVHNYVDQYLYMTNDSQVTN